MREFLGAVRDFYATDLAPCPYLEGRKERRVATPLEPEDSLLDFDRLTEVGFRRSQDWLYRPACPTCRACVSVRIVVDGFAPGRTFRRVLRRNADLVAGELPPVATDEHYELFRRYLAARHEDGGMTAMDRQDYANMIERAAAGTRLVEFRSREDGRLAGVSLTDFVRSGLSGVYKFYRPDEPRRSLGTFIILWHVERARALGLPYVYLGYWVKGSRKMAYKTRFQPLERLEGFTWRPLTPAEAGADGEG